MPPKRRRKATANTSSPPEKNGAGRTATPQIAMPYRDLPLDNCSLRLLDIEPAADDDDPVVCRLSVVAFGSRPKFNSLSYMWGTDEAGHVITMNGVDVKTRGNLFDALRFLRRNFPGVPFWIDAVCINQDDTEERNHQVGIMDVIYFRAQTVVVWLGSRYGAYLNNGDNSEPVEPEPREQDGGDAANYSRNVPTQASEAPPASFAPTGGYPATIRMDNIEPVLEEPPFGIPDRTRRLKVELVSDPYWDRLWILQEICRARVLRVCFGRVIMEWNEFLDFIRSEVPSEIDAPTGLVPPPSCVVRSPVRLDKLLRDERHRENRTLLKLLEAHQDAKCSDPRDKVYGLLGMAIDSAGFVVDYSRSLFQVWEDTMIFLNSHKLIQGGDLIPTALLVKRLLMGPGTVELPPASPLPTPDPDGPAPAPFQDISDCQNPLAFWVYVFLVGNIFYVGPTISELVSKPHEGKMWAQSAQAAFQHPVEKGEVYRESDMMLAALVDQEETAVKPLCFDHSSRVTLVTRHVHLLQYMTEKVVDTTYYNQSGPSRHRPCPTATTEDPRLYVCRALAMGASANAPAWTVEKMGVAAETARPGDFVCWVRGARRALLVRMDSFVYNNNAWRSAKLRVVGTALCAVDVAGVSSDPFERTEVGTRACPQGHFPLGVDAMSIFLLIN